MFTPVEVLEFTAKLKCGLQGQNLITTIKQLLSSFNLLKCRNTPIGQFGKKGLSGGERRRLSIALELLENPDMIFLDEPTSGLDSFTALLVMGLIRKEARRGKVVLCSLHQPSFDMLEIIDNVIIMHEGKTVYVVKKYSC